jgi:hypothetical protein
VIVEFIQEDLWRASIKYLEITITLIAKRKKQKQLDENSSSCLDFRSRRVTTWALSKLNDVDYYIAANPILQIPRSESAPVDAVSTL